MRVISYSASTAVTECMTSRVSCVFTRRIDDDRGRTHELAQCAVKCMRGILECWLRQADKVEKFKHSQSSKNALHVKFHLMTGDVVTKDEEYEHLQVTRQLTVHDSYLTTRTSQLTVHDSYLTTRTRQLTVHDSYLTT